MGIVAMKPTSDDFAPRRDGWFEHRGTWGEVVVGTVIADPSSRTKAWEVIDTAMGAQIEYGHTLWFRVREVTSGEEHPITPKRKTAAVNILTRSPADTKTGELTWPSDSDAIKVIVDMLGAKVMATRDNATGEITCPDKSDGDGLIEHLQFAHGVLYENGTDIKTLITAHGQNHNPKYAEFHAGFPHRHVPEDLSIL